MDVVCEKGCWDAKRNRKYYPGDRDDIDPLEPIAGNFIFPEGTEVYWKKPGTATTPATSTTRIVGGGEKTRDKNQEFLCDICGIYRGREAQLRTHRRFCVLKAEEMEKAEEIEKTVLAETTVE